MVRLFMDEKWYICGCMYREIVSVLKGGGEVVWVGFGFGDVGGEVS